MAKLLSLGIAAQGLFLAIFILAARTQIPTFSKSADLVLALSGMCCIIFMEARKRPPTNRILMIPFLLSCAYIAAFYLIGFIRFGFILKDYEVSTDFLLSNIRILFNVALFYSILTFIIFWLYSLLRSGR